MQWSCIDLEENVLDEFFVGIGQVEIISGVIVFVYGYMRNGVWRYIIYFGLQEVFFDEVIFLVWGGIDWFDGGKYIVLYVYQVIFINEVIMDFWNGVMINIFWVLFVIEVFCLFVDVGDIEVEGVLYEMIILCVYLNMFMLESWGLVFQKENFIEIFCILRGQEVIDYI